MVKRTELLDKKRTQEAQLRTGGSIKSQLNAPAAKTNNISRQKQDALRKTEAENMARMNAASRQNKAEKTFDRSRGELLEALEAFKVSLKGLPAAPGSRGSRLLLPDQAATEMARLNQNFLSILAKEHLKLSTSFPHMHHNDVPGSQYAEYIFKIVRAREEMSVKDIDLLTQGVEAAASSS